ncbi:WXG100 family type VII secretion target [Streptomyces sp. NPDC056224]|uniref:WXG100 family type VII secretion target n=1 Tax=Streptomyces sp. NPDC056224 TaxID=3345750 RepID=UPI0035E270C6
MTNFEGYSHAQLAAMVASLDSKTVSQRGTQLTEASKAIKEIGQKLKDHKVKDWEGEAAVAFQEWVNRAGSATLVLADYSATGGHWMTLAAQTMSEIHMPKYDAAAEATLKENLATSREYHNDPDAQQMGQEAWSKLSGDHTRAVDALRKLSQSYSLSSGEMDKAPVPTFPEPPKVFVPSDYYGGEDIARPGGSSGQGNYSGSSSYASSASGSSGSANEPGWVSGHPPQPDSTVPTVTMPPVSLTPDRNVDVDLDTVTTLPNPTLPPTTMPGGPLPTGPSGPNPVTLVPPVPLPPVGGMKTIPGIGPVGFPPGGPVPGTSGPLGKLGMPGLPPRDTGIMGGRPVTSTGPSAGIPRGTVIGAEGTQAGRGMMGGGMGHGAGGPHGGQVGSPTGRRLASEPGGIVGGRQPATGGRSTPFTQGGSGLVRNNAGGIGAGARTPGGRRDDHAGERPDYLAEDEETWQGNRRVVPPVID